MFLDHGPDFVQGHELERPRRVDHGMRIADIHECEGETATGGVQRFLDGLALDAAQLLPPKRAMPMSTVTM